MGWSAVFLAVQAAIFHEVAQELLEFIDGAPLIIHNAEFDMCASYNAELAQAGLPTVLEASLAVDTLQMARRKFPGSPASLDALCKRFNIDNSARSLHGALLDAELLAEVYLELIGGRQAGLDLVQAEVMAAAAIAAAADPPTPPRPHTATLEELAAHAAMLDVMKQPLWRM